MSGFQFVYTSYPLNANCTRFIIIPYMYIFLLYNTIWMFYGQYADEGDNPLDNTKHT